VTADFLLRPEHSETKAKTEIRDCETKTKNYETETSLVNSVARESKTKQHALFSNIYHIGYFEIINYE